MTGLTKDQTHMVEGFDPDEGMRVIIVSKKTGDRLVFEYDNLVIVGQEDWKKPHVVRSIRLGGYAASERDGEIGLTMTLATAIHGFTEGRSLDVVRDALRFALGRVPSLSLVMMDVVRVYLTGKLLETRHGKVAGAAEGSDRHDAGSGDGEPGSRSDPETEGGEEGPSQPQ